jgi:hypothetical protein
MIMMMTTLNMSVPVTSVFPIPGGLLVPANLNFQERIKPAIDTVRFAAFGRAKQSGSVKQKGEKYFYSFSCVVERGGVRRYLDLMGQGARKWRRLLNGQLNDL